MRGDFAHRARDRSALVKSRGRKFRFVFPDPPEQAERMKIVTIIARILLGLIFVVFGLNGFLHFIHMPPPPPNSAAGHFFAAVSTSGYMSVIFLLQIIGGLLVLLGFYVPLGLTILCPIIFNIVLFHVHMAPEGLPLAIVVSLLALFLIWRYWANFAGLVRQGP
jgi:putative oxidoreductase